MKKNITHLFIAVIVAFAMGYLSSTEFEDMRQDENSYRILINDSEDIMYLHLIDNLSGREVADITTDTILSNIINKDNE